MKRSSKARSCCICLEKNDTCQEMCINLHLYCQTCLNDLYDNLIIENKSITHKCTLCKFNFDENNLRYLLRDDIKVYIQTQKVLKLIKIPENCTLMKCHLCKDLKDQGIFLQLKKDYPKFYTCENKKCKKTMCLHCYGEKTDDKIHNECYEYKDIMLELEKISDIAIMKNCPKCVKGKDLVFQFPSIKDSRCTHIKCDICKMFYCYVCGRHEESMEHSKKDSERIYYHNSDWISSPNKCPMHLQEFSSVLLKWPKDELRATMIFEEYRIKAYIKKVVDLYGFTKVKKTYEIFKDTRLRYLIAEYFLSSQIYKEFKNISLIDKKLFQDVQKLN